MGGFMLYDDDQPKGILTFDFFRDLIEGKAIDFPRITEDDIRDRSKGDAFSKGLVILQTSWFILQCIARWSQHLSLTELELVTLAFAAFNGVMYYLWWNKPLDVRRAFPIYLRKEIDASKQYRLSESKKQLIGIIPVQEREHEAEHMEKVLERKRYEENTQRGGEARKH
jgi:hypothetical protein